MNYRDEELNSIAYDEAKVLLWRIANSKVNDSKLEADNFCKKYDIHPNAPGDRIKYEFLHKETEVKITDDLYVDWNEIDNGLTVAAVETLRKAGYTVKYVTHPSFTVNGRDYAIAEYIELDLITDDNVLVDKLHDMIDKNLVDQIDQGFLNNSATKENNTIYGL